MYMCMYYVCVQMLASDNYDLGPSLLNLMTVTLSYRLFPLCTHRLMNLLEKYLNWRVE